MKRIFKRLAVLTAAVACISGNALFTAFADDEIDYIFYGSGYYKSFSSSNLVIQGSFGANSGYTRDIITGQSYVISTNLTEDYYVSIASNAFASYSNAYNQVNGIGGNGSGARSSTSVYYTTTNHKTANAVRATHGNVYNRTYYYTLLSYTKK